MYKIAHALLRDFAQKYDIERNHIYFINTPYMDESIRLALNDEATSLGFQRATWIKTGCVITCHGGPGAFGIVGTMRSL